MSLRIYSTMRSSKVRFEPLESGRTGMYVCGPTVYGSAHIGHARCYVSFDVIQRYLRASGYEVKYVRNFTDIDDKIIKRAAELGVSPRELAERFIGEYLRDMAALGVARADVEPRVTDHIPEVISLIERLVRGEHAYPSGGDVYFSVASFPAYGRLSGRDTADMLAGARVEPGENKRDPLDFALWKASKPGEPVWESPWGGGRPGWHIECSAMSMKYLGETLDLHGGGKDLVFPHHENEIAQSEAATKKPFVRYFLHNGFVNVDEVKMSKSLGNFFTISEVLRRFDGESLRLFILLTHYRSPINFSDGALAEAARRAEYFYETLAKASSFLTDRQTGEGRLLRPDLLEKLDADFTEAMNDDFNTARALATVQELMKLINELIDGAAAYGRDDARQTVSEAVGAAGRFGCVLGLFAQEPRAYLEGRRRLSASAAGADVTGIERLVVERAEARKAKDFARADAIRKELDRMGVDLKDTSEGTKWKFGGVK